MVKPSTLLGVIIIALVAVGAAAYLLTIPPAPEVQPPPRAKALTIKLAETVHEAKEWVPSTVYLKQGDEIELTVVNGDDDDIHRLAIPELGVETRDIPGANGRDVVTFTVDKVGTFIFIDPLAPDWDSPECQAEREEAEAKAAEEAEMVLGEMVEELEEVVKTLEGATMLSEVAELTAELEGIVRELEEHAREDMVELVDQLEGLARDLGEADTMDEVAGIVEGLKEVTAELEELAEEEPMCVPPGQIIVEP